MSEKAYLKKNICAVMALWYVEKKKGGGVTSISNKKIDNFSIEDNTF